jgi:hypothetical protein
LGHCRRGWSDQQKRAYVIADNRLTDASDWDDEMLRLELNDLLADGFELSLTGIAEDELTKLSVGVAALEAMPELPDGERSPFREMTFILYASNSGSSSAPSPGRPSRATATIPIDRRKAMCSPRSAPSI